MTEHLELRNVAGPGFIPGHGNNLALHAQAEDSRVGPDPSFLPFRGPGIAEERKARQAIAIEHLRQPLRPWSVG